MENHHQQQGAGGGPAVTGPGLDSAASFLQEEEDEFERLFTELLYASHSRAAAKMAEEGEGGLREPPPPPPPSQWPSLKRSHRRSHHREGGEGGPRGAAPSNLRVFVGPGEQLSDYERSLEEQGVILVRSGSASPDTLEDDGEGEVGVYYNHHGGPGGSGGDVRDLGELNGHRIINYSEESCSDEENGSEGSDESYSDRLNRLLPDSPDLPVLHVEESEDEQEEEPQPEEAPERGAGPEQLAASMESFLAKSRQKRPSLQQKAASKKSPSPEQKAAFKKSRSFQCGDSGDAASPQQQAAFRKSHSFQSGDSGTDVARAAAARDRHSDGSFGSGGVLAKGGDTGDKLFFDLLDDLDDLTGNTQSMKRRQRARDIFSDWLFSEQLKREGEQKKKNRQSFHEFMSYREEDEEEGDADGRPADGQPERQSRAGSEPSEGKHGNNNRNSYGNTDFAPLQKAQAKPLSMSDKDAVLERQMREEYLTSQDTGTVLKSPSTIRRAPTPRSDSPCTAVKSTPTTTTPSPQTKPAAISNKSTPNTSSQQPSPFPNGKNSPKSNRGSGLGANVDTLEMLKHVKFRKKSPKCQVYSEAEAKAEQLSSRFNALGVGPRNIYQRWKLKGRPISFEYLDEDDADSGYHTGESTLRGGGGAPTTAPPPPGERTLTREDLKRRIDAFNDNQHGLLMTLRESTDTFQGFIRVYMNLMRPISMSLTARPPSIYDILTPDSDPPDTESDTQLTSFYLPKDTTKVIHITSDTTAQEVIRALLQKFRITDNPRKFALYERLDEGTSKSTMRRLRDDECPLALCLSWTADGLNFHRFVLQENDTGEIMWEAFSIPELDNFLRILDREEEEYVEQVKAKYHLMKIQMQQHMKHLSEKQRFKDQRTPVFV